MRWAALAAAIAAYDVWLDRHGFPMLSHDAWSAFENPRSRWLPVGTGAAVVYHLFRVRRPWREALTVGAAAAVTTRMLR